MTKLMPILAAIGLALAAMTSPADAQSDPATASAGDPGAGEKAFQARCARCHKTEDMKPYLAKAPDVEVARRNLDAFLGKHHGGNEEMRAAIIAYLLALP